MSIHIHLRNARNTWPMLASHRPVMLRAAGERKAHRQMIAAGLRYYAREEVAQRLRDTGVWNRSVGRKKLGATRANEPRRVNVVNPQLCDDIIKYLGPSLERHRGCDLIDLNPGAGLWSRSLHDFLEPRKHVMMDLDAELYQPFLSDLLEKDNVHLIPKAGILWKDLIGMINTHLSHQKETEKGQLPTRNDTLLITANLSTFPKKSFLGFDSVSTMVTYQLVSSIRTSSLFQKYGLVRMLVWINDEDKSRLVPRSIISRKRLPFEAELACEWIHEVAGIEPEVEDRLRLRDQWINIESRYNALERMQRSNIVTPKGRETKGYTEMLGSQDLTGVKLAGVYLPNMSRPFKQELEELQGQQSIQESVGDELLGATKRLKYLRARDERDHETALVYLDLLQKREEAFRLYKESPVEFAAADAAWNEKLDNTIKNVRDEFGIMRDNYHIFRQDPPALLWDRRAYEPLSVRADEFFPNAPTALLDIQPKTMDPLFLRYGPQTDRSGAISDVLLRSWFNHMVFPMGRAMEGIAGGFSDSLSECPSITDSSRGGSPMTGRGALTARSINGQQWAEIVQAWMNWPFRPSYSRLLGLMEDEVDSDEDDGRHNTGGMTF